MMKDKDYAACIPLIARHACHVIGCTVGLPRSLAPEEIARTAGEITKADWTAELASALALAGRDPGNLIVVCGSVFGAGEALRVLSSAKQERHC